MSDIADTDVVFDGVSGLNSDTFVRHIRRRVLAEGKHKDDELVAATAASCLEGPALDWYEDQPTEVQDDWKLLRRAILARWPSSTNTAAPPITAPPSAAIASAAAPPLPARAATSPGSNFTGPAAASFSPPAQAAAASFPTPASAPPLWQAPAAAPPLPVRYGAPKGRIRAHSQHPNACGYLSLIRNQNGHHRVVKDVNEGMIVQIYPAGRSHDVQIISPITGYELQTLGITWREPDSPVFVRNKEITFGAFATLSGVPRSTAPRSTSTMYSGPSGSDIWSITRESLINLSWEVEPGLRQDLIVWIGLISGTITLSNGHPQYIKDARNDWTTGFLEFEPL